MSLIFAPLMALTSNSSSHKTEEEEEEGWLSRKFVFVFCLLNVPRHLKRPDNEAIAHRDLNITLSTKLMKPNFQSQRLKCSFRVA